MVYDDDDGGGGRGVTEEVPCPIPCSLSFFSHVSSSPPYDKRGEELKAVVFLREVSGYFYFFIYSLGIFAGGYMCGI